MKMSTNEFDPLFGVYDKLGVSDNFLILSKQQGLIFSSSRYIQLLLLDSSFLQRIERGFKYKHPQMDSLQITFFLHGHVPLKVEFFYALPNSLGSTNLCNYQNH